MEVIYADNHLFVVNKPSGLLTQPSGTEQVSLQDQAKAWIKEKERKPGNVFLEPIHRLDKPASGIVVFARTSKALSRLQDSMRNKQAKKTYLALVEGIPREAAGTLQHYLIHSNYRAFCSSKPEKGAKLAILNYQVIRSEDGLSLLEIDLVTGRYHQIRAQLASIGHPILGDAKYGARKKYSNEGIGLHHFRFSIPHPIGSERLTWEHPGLIS